MSFETIIAMLTGFLMRIGLPILITAMLARFLHRLDQRWQQEIKHEQRKVLREVLTSNERCWQIKGCSPEHRKACVAFQDPAIPCWEHFRNGHGDLRGSCLECEVFRNIPIPLAA